MKSRKQGSHKQLIINPSKPILVPISYHKDINTIDAIQSKEYILTVEEGILELPSSLNASRALKDLDTDDLFLKSGFSAPADADSWTIDAGPNLKLVRILYAWSDQDQHF